MLFREKINALWIRITGESSAFPLEFRIFHAICFITLLALVYNTVLNSFLGLYALEIFSLSSFFIFSYLYYRSLFKGKIKSSIIMCAALANLLFIANYFYNSGISGPTIFLSGYPYHNAIKFTQVGGVVDISTEMLLNECKINIRDNGKGIAFDQQPDIFSLKAKSTFGTGNEKGVGLGLLLCKEFIDQQGGRIGFDSTPGVGSTFFIYMTVGQLVTVFYTLKTQSN